MAKQKEVGKKSNAGKQRLKRGAKKASASKPGSGKAEVAKVTLAPNLSVRNGAEAVEFYKAAFGARELFKIADPDGAVVAHLAVGQADFWVADESPEHLNFSPETLGGGTVRMVMVVEDPDAVFAHAVSQGAIVVSPVTDESYGWRLGRIVDPFGHHWEIGKPLARG